MGVIKFNVGLAYTVTAPGSGTMSVTIQGRTFTEAFDTSAATTATNFVASHAKEINELFEVYIVASTADVIFYGVPSGLPFDTPQTYTVNSSREASYQFTTTSLTTASNVNTLVVKDAGTTVTTATVTYLDAASALEDADRLRHAISKDVDKVGSIKAARRSNSTFA